MTPILIAGIGNIFNGDDAFGVEVVHRLARRSLPAGVKVIDFGIRGIDLTYALLDGYLAAVLVDTAARRTTGHDFRRRARPGGSRRAGTARFDAVAARTRSGEGAPARHRAGR
jgi:hypothetical protein